MLARPVAGRPSLRCDKERAHPLVLVDVDYGWPRGVTDYLAAMHAPSHVALAQRDLPQAARPPSLAERGRNLPLVEVMHDCLLRLPRQESIHDLAHDRSL